MSSAPPSIADLERLVAAREILVARESFIAWLREEGSDSDRIGAGVRDVFAGPFGGAAIALRARKIVVAGAAPAVFLTTPLSVIVEHGGERKERCFPTGIMGERFHDAVSSSFEVSDYDLVVAPWGRIGARLNQDCEGGVGAFFLMDVYADPSILQRASGTWQAIWHQAVMQQGVIVGGGCDG